MKERSCPHGGKYCFDYGSCENCEWGKILQKNKRYRAKIRELKEDLRIEKHNHGVTKEFYNNSVANSEKIFAEQKAEIERLHKGLQEEFVSLKAVKIAQNSPQAMKMLVESIGCVQKDTAKEIFEKIFGVLFCFTTQGKSEEYNEGFIQCLSEIDERIQKLAKEHGVEVDE